MLQHKSILEVLLTFHMVTPCRGLLSRCRRSEMNNSSVHLNDLGSLGGLYFEIVRIKHISGLNMNRTYKSVIYTTQFVQD